MAFVVGVDGCKRGWVAVALKDGAFASAAIYPSVLSIPAVWTDAAAIAVDIPIGLTEAKPRDADVAARAFLKNRSSAVFLVPPRAVVAEREWADACRVARAKGEPGFSKQAFALFEKIREADALVGDARVHEVHPEVSFAALAGRVLQTKKQTWDGVAERRAALAKNGIVIPDDIGNAGGASVDDVLDAAVAAWSADRIARSAERSFPNSETQRDGCGRVIRIKA
jgi:predicted RNase H-like nuclease